MIAPVITKPLLHSLEKETAVGIEALIGEELQHLAFDLQAGAGNLHQPFQARQEIPFIAGEVRQPGQVDRHHTR